MTDDSGSPSQPVNLPSAAASLTGNSAFNPAHLTAESTESDEALSDLAVMDALGVLNAEETAQLAALLHPENPDTTIDRERLRTELFFYHRLMTLVASAASVASDKIPSPSPSPSVKAKILARFTQAKPAIETQAAPVHAATGIETHLAALFQTVQASEAAWQRVSADGMDMKILSHDQESGQVVLLLRGEAGASFPAHRHTQAERCYLIEGAVRIGDVYLKAGDFHLAKAGSTHERLVAETPALALLIACGRDYLSVLSRRHPSL